MLCGLRAGWGRSRAAAGPGRALCEASSGGCSSSGRAPGGEPELEAAAAAGGETLAGWDEAGGGLLWGQIASRGGCCCCGEEAAAEGDGVSGDWGSAAGPRMAAPPPPGYPLSDPGSNSERSADSPLPSDGGGCSAGPSRAAPSDSPEWGEERFRVDRKKLEAMLQGEPGRRGRRRGGRLGALSPRGGGDADGGKGAGVAARQEEGTGGPAGEPWVARLFGSTGTPESPNFPFPSLPLPRDRRRKAGTFGVCMCV